MAAGDLTPARRVHGDDIEALERAGDYLVGTIEEKGAIHRCAWFLLPCHEGTNVYDRPTPCSGLHMIREPIWSIRECPDGSAEIRASILAFDVVDGVRTDLWHGYLHEGNVWEEV
jgi:hypothetical protein